MIYLDKYATSGRLNKWHPVFKLGLFFCFLTLSLVIKDTLFLFIYGAVLGIVSLLISRYGHARLICFYSFLVFFVSLSALPLLVEKVETADAASFYYTQLPFNFGISPHSLHAFLQVASRCFAAGSAVLFLILTMPVSQLLYLMQRAKLPTLFVELCELVHRNIFMLMELADKIFIAQKSRMGYETITLAYRHFSTLIAQTFQLSFRKADSQYNGLLSRCYDDEAPVVCLSPGIHQLYCTSFCVTETNLHVATSNTSNDTASNQPVLSLQHINYTYPDGTPGLRDVSLEIAYPQKIVLLGENGSGKSTLFLTLNGILKPDNGTYIFKGYPIQYTRAQLFRLRKEVGVVFQDSNSQLFSPTIYEELAFGLANLHYTKEQIQQEVELLVEQFDLSLNRERSPHLLSEGQKKWVSIASIVATNPSLLVLDEPTSNLDAKHARRVLTEVDRLHAQGKTIVLSTHDVDLAYQWADRIVVMHAGSIIKDGTPVEVFSDDACIGLASLDKPLLFKMRALLPPSGSTMYPRTAEQMISFIQST